MSYHELWNILLNWKRDFTIREFNSAFFSPNSAKILHDMIKLGFLEKVGWGKYRVNSPERILNQRLNFSRAYELVREARMKYAFTANDAVFFWTKGGYQVDRFFGFYPIHIKVETKNLGKWMEFFKIKKKTAIVYDKPIKETLFGIFYVLYPEESFDAVQLDSFTVIPLDETVKFCQANIYSYEPALEMLDEMYGLGLKTKYKETKTNM